MENPDHTEFSWVVMENNGIVFPDCFYFELHYKVINNISVHPWPYNDIFSLRLKGFIFIRLLPDPHMDWSRL